MPVTLTIYRSDCDLFRGDWALVSWSDWSFHPIQPAERECESGNRKLRDRPLPFQIRLPPLSRFDGRSVFPSGDLIGIDAASAWWLASRGERGFRVYEGEKKCV